MPAPGTGAAGGALTGLDVRRRSGAKPSHSHDAQASEGGTHVDEARLLPRSTDTQTRQTWTEFSHKSPKDQAIEVASLQNKAAAVADHWDRNRARPAVGEGFPFLLFRLQDGFTVPPWLTFPEAPL
jgi:hypothetical protein